MTSTNKTANIGLNQWVLRDPFLMEDMNADNQKIDAAFGESPYVKLLSVTTAANAAQIDLSLSGMDLTKYSAIKIEACYGCTPTNSVGYIYVRINNISTLSYYQSGDSNVYTYLFRGYASYSTSIPACLKAEISGISGAPSSQAAVKSILREAKFYGNISDTNQFGTCPLSTISLPKATALNSINIATGDAAKYIQAGSEFTLYGVKK